MYKSKKKNSKRSHNQWKPTPSGVYFPKPIDVERNMDLISKIIKMFRSGTGTGGIR